VTRSPQAALWPLLLGNFVIGTGVMAPAGLIRELTAAFAVDVAAVGSLIAWGGALLCIEAPLVAFATSRLDRRVLLAGALLLFAAGHLASACAGTFHTLLAIRLVMIAAVACFTPQAASAVALFVPRSGGPGPSPSSSSAGRWPRPSACRWSTCSARWPAGEHPFSCSARSACSPRWPCWPPCPPA
jgi:MFS family permease